MLGRYLRKVAVTAGVVGALAGSALCQAGTLARVEQRGKLVMLCWPHQDSVFVRRMVREYGEQGLHQFDGIDVDLMRAFAERLGVELEVRPGASDFAGLIPSLLAGEGDVVASYLTITKTRGEIVDFSTPYFTVEEVVVTRRDSPISSLSDLPGKRAAVMDESSLEEHLLDLDVPSMWIETVQFELEAYLMVLDGQADFTLADAIAAQRVLERYPELARTLHVVFALPETQGFGFAVAPGSDLRESLDRFIEEMRQSGELGKIVARHLPAQGRCKGC